MITDQHGSSRDEETVVPAPVSGSESEGVDGAQELTARQQEVQAIKDSANLRDEQATARDVASDKRDVAADLAAFLDPGPAYTGLAQRRSAAVDRSFSRDDREAAAVDRERLTEEDESSVDDGSSSDRL